MGVRSKEKNYKHYKINLINKNETLRTFFEIKPDYVIHFAAESHVDKSIINPEKIVFFYVCIKNFE